MADEEEVKEVKEEKRPCWASRILLLTALFVAASAIAFLFAVG